MILIADSGSTKTTWLVIDNGTGNNVPLQIVKTLGINPYYQTSKEIDSSIKEELIANLKYKQFDCIYFYGAGCSKEKEMIVNQVLTSNFKTRVQVASDLLGAARSLCGHAPGIACILGTGSNSCFYDGLHIAQQVSPLGFILGDEGSGAVLGKLLVGDILKCQISEDICHKFFECYSYTPGFIIEKVYRLPFPNRFLASFVPFILENIEHPDIRCLVKKSFLDFFKRNVMLYDYSSTAVHFTGSVAFLFRDILQEVASSLNIQLGKIEQYPIDGLITYHNYYKK